MVDKLVNEGAEGNGKVHCFLCYSDGNSGTHCYWQGRKPFIRILINHNDLQVSSTSATPSTSKRNTQPRLFFFTNVRLPSCLQVSLRRSYQKPSSNTKWSLVSLTTHPNQQATMKFIAILALFASVALAIPVAAPKPAPVPTIPEIRALLKARQAECMCIGDTYW
jgi:hypothetical protein